MIPYLILHRVRGEPAFDIAHQMPMNINGRKELWWTVTTSGHRAYPYRWWALEDLSDISDINAAGAHERPATLDHTLPADWPDHYAAQAPVRAKIGAPINLSELGLE